MREHLLYIGGGWRKGGAGTMPAPASKRRQTAVSWSSLAG
jgi:hypothetical protein